jgi:hypothetical protein
MTVFPRVYVLMSCADAFNRYAPMNAQAVSPSASAGPVGGAAALALSATLVPFHV